MHYIWKRFINVLFVNQYEQTIRRRDHSMINKTVFELSTVPYPLPIKQTFVTKTLDFWRNGKYRYGTKLNMDKTENLKGDGECHLIHSFIHLLLMFFFSILGQQMTVCVLKHTPGVTEAFRSEDNITTYSGLEIEVTKLFNKIKFYITTLIGFPRSFN